MYSSTSAFFVHPLKLEDKVGQTTKVEGLQEITLVYAVFNFIVVGNLTMIPIMPIVLSFRVI